MQNINLDDFLTEGIIKEKDFREKVKPVDNILNRENSIASQGSNDRMKSWAEKQFGW